MKVQFLGWEDPLEKEMAPTPVFLPVKSRGQRSLAVYNSWGCKRVRYDLVTKWQQQHKLNYLTWLSFGDHVVGEGLWYGYLASCVLFFIFECTCNSLLFVKRGILLISTCINVSSKIVFGVGLSLLHFLIWLQGALYFSNNIRKLEKTKFITHRSLRVHSMPGSTQCGCR